ncbi:MAG: MBOAT family protein [Pirellulaceae bacterium]|jgi:D-alanyl-lipoteichoic acid acyltransferase DltB (MBOAT superfamily)|nr:MBOAT family protein [Pirellulaceae bacterium]MDP7303666.1 MBOAT family protein [Pirellulaceae bacterium]HJN13702.1 MBOAT family protein [Pirellulaceae bacterium]
MLFHTWPFFLFLLVVLAVYLALRRTRLAVWWLFVASYLFYGWWNPLYLLLIFYSTLVDYFAVILMDRGRHKKLWLWVSLVSNLSLLVFFKYSGFVTDNLNSLLTAAGVGVQLDAPDVLLPVGISFFTFQSMSYTIDFYRGKIPRERSFIRFATFVAFFPQLVAGPIERAKALLPQLAIHPRVTREDITDGLSLFLVGLFKKIALANYLALYVDQVYLIPDQYSAPALMLATFAFAWQIYFDFSGYTDMARGVARMMGYRLMLNFNNPYLATGLTDFWSRWHISLSTWFRDYVYIPLGGNRHGGRIMYRNLFLTFVISGVWHGAGWNFVVWGLLHAIGTVITHAGERSVWYAELPRFLKQLLVFVFVCFTWIFFRAESLGDAWLIVNRIGSSGWHDPAFPLLALLLVSSVWLYQFLHESRFRRLLSSSVVQVALAVLMILYLCISPGAASQPFIYFQF